MRNFILLLLVVFCTRFSLTAQTRCARFESILVDACGSPEGENEMFRFKIGSANMNTANFTVTWSSNPWLGVCQNATTAANIATWNATITQCGLLVEPVNGVLPAGKEVLFVTSENVNTALYSFAALQDTLIVMFQCGSTTTGHFKNYQAGAGPRTTSLHFSGVGGCSDTATYIVDSLINQNGIHSATLGDGATVNFTNGVATSYTNQGCTPIIPVMSVHILTNDTSLCQGSPILLNAIAANYKNLKWVGGMGTFTYTDSLNTTYTPGVNEIYPLSLILRAYQSCSGDSLADTVKISTALISVNLTSTHNAITCTNPQVTITASGANGLSYNWGGGNTTASNTVSAGGIYTVTASGSGCTAIASDTIGQNTTVPNASIAPPASLTCHVASVVLTASSTTPGATYSWGGGVTTATNTVTAAGNYTVTVADPGNGCTATATTTVGTVGGVITLSQTQTNPGCSSNNGSATVNATTGSAPFTYLWSTTDTTATVSGIGAGTYSVTVTDAGGCSAIANYTITVSGSVALTTSATGTSCGNSNGSVNVNATGTGPYVYHWNTGATTASVSNLAAATYLVTVTDAGGCSATSSVVVNPSVPDSAVTISADRLIMCSGDSAHICAPVGYASYVWNNGSNGPCIATTNAGNYYVTVTDNAGCTAISNHQAIAVLPLPPVSISVNGDTLTVYAANTIQWYLNGNIIPGATAPIYIAPVAGNYTVAITDSNECSAVSTAVAYTPVGISDIIKDGDIGFYPNPSADGKWILIAGTSLMQSQVEIFDNNGRVVYRSEIRDLRTEIALTVSRGIYLVHIYNSENNIYRKLIKL